MRAVFDSNIFISALDPNDIFHSKAKPLLTRLQAHDIELYEPALVLIEVSAALHRRTKQPDTVRRVFNDLLHHESINWVDVTLETIIETNEIAIETSLRGADAVIVHVADSFELPLVTQDGEITQRTPERIKTLTLEQV